MQKFQEIKSLVYFVSAACERMSLQLYMPPAEVIDIILLKLPLKPVLDACSTQTKAIWFMEVQAVIVNLKN